MKIGDLVRFTPAGWGTPLEDRPLGIVVSEEHIATDDPDDWNHIMVTVRFPGESHDYATSPDTLELVSEAQ